MRRVLEALGLKSSAGSISGSGLRDWQAARDEASGLPRDGTRKRLGLIIVLATMAASAIALLLVAILIYRSN